MRVEFKAVGSPKKRCRVPFDGCDHVLADGFCPQCGAGDDGAFKVAGARGGQIVRRHDRYVAAAYCWACRKHVGFLAVIYDTIFGLEEDERMSSGRYGRVY